MLDALERHFEFSKYQTSFRREVLAGVTTFVALAYIFAVNPAILSAAGIPFDAVLFATAFCSAFATALMGFWANKPFSLAPGMGMNAYVAQYVVQVLGIPWPVALGIVFWSGVLNVALSVSPIRDRIIRSIPESLKNGIAVGVGVFIALIGLRTAGVLQYSGVQIQGFGDLGATPVLLTGAGVVLMSLLHFGKVTGSILIGMIALTVVGVVFGLSQAPTALVAVPRGAFDAFFALDLIGALAPSTWTILIALFLIDFFSSVGTFIGVSLSTNLLDKNGEMPQMREALIADSLATPVGAIFGTTSITTYIETAAGVQAGGRTGFTALVVAALMLPMLFFSPIVSVIPGFATAPALIFVGVLMMTPIRSVREYDLAGQIGFVVLVLGTLATFAIDQGMLYGFSAFIILKWLTRRQQEISGFLYVTTLVLIVGKLISLL